MSFLEVDHSSINPTSIIFKHRTKSMHQSPTHSTHIPQATDKTHLSTKASPPTTNEIPWSPYCNRILTSSSTSKGTEKESIVFIIDKNHHILPIQWFPANIPII